jgi:chromosome segregation ATPase
MADALEPGAENAILENLEEVHSELNSIFNSHSQRILEFKVVVAEGIKRAQEAIQVQHNLVLDLLRSNAEVARQAAVDMGSMERFQNLQSELSGQIGELKEMDRNLGETIERLTSDRDEASRRKKDLATQIDDLTDAIHQLNVQLDHLERDNDALKKEKTALTKEQTRLQTEVDRLKKIKDEHLSSIARYQELKKGLMA